MGFGKGEQAQPRLDIVVNIHGINDILKPVLENDADDLLVTDQVPVPFGDPGNGLDAEHDLKKNGALGSGVFFDLFSQFVHSVVQRVDI